MKKAFRVLSIDQTLHNPLNNSTSKQQFSFEKELRFKHNIKTEGADVIYDNNDLTNKLSYSFGVLKKDKIFHLKDIYPQPGTYTIQG